jgi:uncharacterized membrane protein (DUF2068 family)
MKRQRPFFITLLSIFFALGATISLVAGVSLLFPSSFLEPMWQLNTRAQFALAGIRFWGVLLLVFVSICCAIAAIGLWRRQRWGRGVAIGLIGINLLADIINFVLGIEPKAIIGVPIAGVILAYLLSRKVKLWFSEPNTNGNTA